MILRLAAIGAAAVAVVATGPGASATTAPFPAPINFHIAGMSGGYPVLAWDPPANPPAPITRYKVVFAGGIGRYSTTTTFTVANDIASLCLPDPHDYTVVVRVGNGGENSAPLHITD